MRITLHLLLGLLILQLAEAQPSFAQTDAEHHDKHAALTDRPGRRDPALRARFLTDYRMARGEKRGVLKQYLPTLGADGILDALEAQNPLCHSEAHDLGKEIFAQMQELGSAIHLCGNRCSSGCMHGLMREAFAGDTEHTHQGHHLTLAEVKPKIKTICGNKAVTDKYEPGNCAHGVGHAILALSGYDLGEALQSCTVFESGPLTYYCATGVFMEYESQPQPPQPNMHSLHYPCDTYTQFPVACYKYRARFFLRAFHGNFTAAAKECLPLEPAQRRGCFYGIGVARMPTLAKNPEQLSTICEFGDAQDQTMCINGAIETLADYQPEAALKACGTLTGEKAALCLAAARNKRYGLEKDFSLYYQQ